MLPEETFALLDAHLARESAWRPGAMPPEAALRMAYLAVTRLEALVGHLAKDGRLDLEEFERWYAQVLLGELVQDSGREQDTRGER